MTRGHVVPPEGVPGLTRAPGPGDSGTLAGGTRVPTAFCPDPARTPLFHWFFDKPVLSGGMQCFPDPLNRCEPHVRLDDALLASRHHVPRQPYRELRQVWF